MRRRGENSWQLRVYVGRDPKSGRKRYMERTFHGGQRQAGRALAALAIEVERLTPRTASEGTMEALFNEWLAHAAPSFSPKTVDTTLGYLRKPIIPALGALQASRITTADLDRFYRSLLERGGPSGPYAPATIRRIHGIVRRALTQGVRWGWLSHNPALDASPPRVRARVLSPPSPDELVRLLQFAEATDPDLTAFIWLASSTGARRGELLAMRRSDVDLVSATVTIERGIVIANGKLIEQGTKTHQTRCVALDSSTIGMLRSHFDRQDVRANASATSVSRSAFVFSHDVECVVPWRPDSTTRAFRKLCHEVGIHGIRLHDLRHYVATRLLAAGVDVRTVAGRLGHRNASTTLNVYAHFVPGTDRGAAKALGEVLSSALAVRKAAETS
ncbi:MAG TPA: site-specific integrase [Acidimicrobiales bacterium]|nr:site-specific integrase [Acidimicrobiales bacterium]